MMTRTIVHVDMDAFYASVEQARQSELRGKPIVVTGAQSRTVILTAFDREDEHMYEFQIGGKGPKGRKVCAVDVDG